MITICRPRHCHDYNLQASSKGGGEFADVDVQQLDWVEDNRKVVMGMLTLQFIDTGQVDITL